MLAPVGRQLRHAGHRLGPAIRRSSPLLGQVQQSLSGGHCSAGLALRHALQPQGVAQRHCRFCSTNAQEQPQSPSLEELRAKVEEAQGQLQQLSDKLAGSKADLQQATKRHQGDLENENKYGYTKFALSLLHVPDNLERAIDSVKTDELDESEELRGEIEGVKKIRHVVEEALAKFGVVKMKALDDTFNPQQHEAMFAMPMPGKEPNTIFHVMEPGYLIYDRTLRAAKVGIAK
eukprot:TRINITY_DN2183_c0_g1_i1.p1 TRINITY_DN2183_c0_g1~~TRINITY_DN2183_c0_g1_i1.p1  ORF type:complete len:233 (-),score=55.61 TRINITY_DN2183_c0_g1_i1:140-838(-)